MHKALIVDDEEDMRELLRSLFEMGGYEVCEAGNGLEAMKKALVFRPDIVVTDICMPVMDGWEFIKKLRENEMCRNIPVIVVTGRSPEREVYVAKNPLNCLFMTKPFELDEIMTMSRRMLAVREDMRFGTTVSREIPSIS